MALSIEREGDRGSDEALRIKALALKAFNLTKKPGWENAVRQRDMGDETAIRKWTDGLGLQKETAQLFLLGLQISEIEKYAIEQRKHGEFKGPVGLQITLRGKKVDIPILPAIESK